MKISKILKVTRICISIFFIIISVIGFFSSQRNSTEQIKYYLNDPKGIVVDDNGKIYCGLRSKEKIVIYDKDGNFIGNIKINALGGVFRIKLEKNNLLVATSRNNLLIHYDQNANLIEQKEIKGIYEAFGNENEYRFKDKFNNIYIINNFLEIWPSIVKVSPNGEKITLVSIPFSKWIFNYPYPAWIFGFLGMFLLSPALEIIIRFLKNYSRSR